MVTDMLQYGPFLELAFYHPRWNSADSFALLVAIVDGLGINIPGMITYHRGPGKRSEPFISKTDTELIEETLSRHELIKLLDDPNIRVCEVAIADPFDIQGKGLISVLPISPEAHAHDTHPIGIFTDGSVFSGPVENEGAAIEFGQRVLDLFEHVVCQSKPGYANISVEVGLECISDLKRDPRSYAFQDFFISQSLTGTDNAQRILQLFEGAYRKPLLDGYYISCYSFFNPDLISLPGASWLSAEVSAILSGIT